MFTNHIVLLGRHFQEYNRNILLGTEVIVVLPEHVLWNLPENGFNYSLCRHRIKSYFTKSLIKGILQENWGYDGVHGVKEYRM